MSNPGTRVDVYGSNRETTDGQTDKYLRVNRDGSLYVVDRWESLAEQGRIFTSDHGTLTTPLTFLALASLRPDVVLRNPVNSGRTILPLSVAIILETVTGTITECEIRKTHADPGNGTSTAASQGPISNRPGRGVSAVGVPRHLYTADSAAESSPVTVFRSVYTFAQATTEGNDPFGWYVTREMMGYPVLDEDSGLLVYISGTTNQATGFVVMQWAELPENDL